MTAKSETSHLRPATWRDRFTLDSGPSRRNGRIVACERLLLPDVTGSIRPKGVIQPLALKQPSERADTFAARVGRPAMPG